MDGYTLNILSHFTVCIPFLTNIFLVKKIDAKYYPFFYFIFLITLSDLLVVLFIHFHPKISVATVILNINVLAEALILTWMYQQWGLFENRKGLYKLLFFSFIVISMLETILFKSVLHPNYYYVTFYNFIGALMSIGMMNRLFKLAKEPLYINPIFTVCTGFIIYYLGDIIPLVFSLHFFKASSNFRWQMVYIADTGVTLTYLIFTYALILMARNRFHKFHKGYKVSLKE